MKGFPTFLTFMRFLSSINALRSHHLRVMNKVTFLIFITFLAFRILWCFIKSDLLLKAFSHSPHLESFSLLWLLSCWLWCGWDLEVLHSLDSQDFAPVGAVWGALGSVCWMEVDLSSKVIMACLKCSSGSLSKWHLTSLVYLTLGHSRLELISLFVISGCNDLIS